ncbi:MAG: DUF86 domain-containing protein [Bacteroidales bacterium]|nr:DUF86 domain-containing protein [Bacteroidales bacterium]
MREQVRDQGRLEHILNAINTIETFIKEQTFDSFSTNAMMYFAVVKNIEIIGEAAYMLTKEFRETHLEVEWQDIISMRHVLVHGYYQISKEEVWDTATQNIPPLKLQIEHYLSEMDEQ